MRQIFKEQSCPKCGIWLTKEGGCDHVICNRCKHEFCWKCGGSFYNYHHETNKNCFKRSVFHKMVIYTLGIMLNFKIGYLISPLLTIEEVLMKYVGSFAGMIVFLISFLIHYINYEYLIIRLDESKELVVDPITK